MKELDKKDWQLLDILGDGSRNAVGRAANELRIHKNSVIYRINRLKKLEVIERFSILPSISALGKNTFYVFLHLKSSPDKDKQTREYLCNHPDIIMIIRLCGKWNLMLELVCNDLNNFNDKLAQITTFLGDQINDYSTVFLYIPYKVENTICFDKNHIRKEFYRAKEHANLDSIDRSMLGLLSDNSEITHNQIATQIGISPDASFYRLKKLQESKVIVKFIPIINLEKIGFQRYLITLKLANINDKSFERISQFIKSEHSIYFAFRTAGELGLVIFCAHRNNKDLDAFINNLQRAVGGTHQEQNVLIINEVVSLNYVPGSLRK
ncbi:Lrp/AsnC family transcriptional regulator [Candidatus Micrarchaeota archaeon]|nr:Lrp/AsnC family transcriptional regulator [Candidatus Micrarchaeota archaeon]